MSLPTASAYEPAGTSIVHNPSAVGVNVPLYLTGLMLGTVAKLLIEPFVTTISPTTSPTGVSVDSKVKRMVASFDVTPEFTSKAVIVILGETVSEVQRNLFPEFAARLALLATSI